MWRETAGRRSTIGAEQQLPEVRRPPPLHQLLIRYICQFLSCNQADVSLASFRIF